VFFLLAGGWFVAMAVLSNCTVAQRAACAYHAAMMLATAWMYTVAHKHLPPGQSGTGASQPEMPAMPATHVHASGASSGWVIALNWFWTATFVVAAVFWTYRLVRARPQGPARDWPGWLTILAQAMMAAGMAIMFAAILFHA
jgi:hypothetical protein